ncbi:MAG: DUF2062 domain-containing protein [Polyangiaceae bacterium]
MSTLDDEVESEARASKPTWRERVRLLYDRVRNEHAAPHHVGEAVALGAFIGCSPFLGLHGWIALGVATLLRRNRLFCFVGSRVCVFFIYPWMVLLQIQLVHRIRTGQFVSATKDTILSQASHLLVDWVLGWLLVGIPLAAMLGALAYAWAKKRDAREAQREAAVSQRSTSRFPPPSSEPQPSSSAGPPP